MREGATPLQDEQQGEHHRQQGRAPDHPAPLPQGDPSVTPLRG
jgi:hypothetical protein